MNSWWGTTATTCIFIAAAITDWLDGYLARKVCDAVVLETLKEKHMMDFSISFILQFTQTFSVVNQMNLGSAFGAFLDPVADKVCYPFFIELLFHGLNLLMQLHLCRHYKKVNRY